MPIGDEAVVAAQRLEDQLVEHGLTVMIDDRPQGPGARFADADLIGVPLRVTLGKRTVTDGTVDLRLRARRRRGDAAGRAGRGAHRRAEQGAPAEMSAAPSEPFGSAVARLMRERGLSYRGLARETGLSAGYLNHLVQGTRPAPSDEVLERLAGALGVTVDRFTEHRLRRVVERLAATPELVDRLYAETVQD